LAHTTAVRGNCPQAPAATQQPASATQVAGSQPASKSSCSPTPWRNLADEMTRLFLLFAALLYQQQSGVDVELVDALDGRNASTPDDDVQE
jgi:hypothetical protein